MPKLNENINKEARKAKKLGEQFCSFKVIKVEDTLQKKEKKKKVEIKKSGSHKSSQIAKYSDVTGDTIVFQYLLFFPAFCLFVCLFSFPFSLYLSTFYFHFDIRVCIFHFKFKPFNE